MFGGGLGMVAAGMGSSFTSAFQNAQALRLEQQKMQFAQQRDLMARTDTQRAEMWKLISDSINGVYAAGGDTESAVKLITPLVAPLERFTKSSGFDPAVVRAQLAALLSRQSSFDIAAGARRARQSGSQPGAAFTQGGAAPTPFVQGGSAFAVPSGPGNTTMPMFGGQGQPSAQGALQPFPALQNNAQQQQGDDQEIDALSRAMAVAETPGLKEAYAIRLREAVKRQAGAAGDHIEIKELPGEGGVKHLIGVNKRTQSAMDLVTHTQYVYPDPAPDKKVETAKKIASAIKEGRQPPVLTGLYKNTSEVRAALEDEGVDLTEMQLEWTRSQQQIRALNGQRMIQYTGLADSVLKTIGRVKKLSSQLDQSGVTWVNWAELQGAVKNLGNTERGKLAAEYIAGINILRGEMAQLENGGFAPTESAWKVAFEQTNENYGKDELESALSEVQRLIRYRISAIPNLYSLGPGKSLRYNLPGERPPWQTDESDDAPPASAAPAQPGLSGSAKPGLRGRTNSGLDWEMR